MESAVRLEAGTLVRGKWTVMQKLGEGGCGVVYAVKDGKTKAALKVEPCNQHKDDEILKMEVMVLRLMQKSEHACRLIDCGKTDVFNFVVMSLLDRALSDLRRAAPDQRLSTSTTVRLGAQCLEAISDLHVVGFVHRDIKPANFALGVGGKKRTVFLLDYGLARQFLIKEQNGAMALRPPRTEVPFRGTVRYCSRNVHLRMEQGRHDDLWSLLYMLIEMVVGSLPWRNMDRKAAANEKESVETAVLFDGCPREFHRIKQYISRLTYSHAPDYATLHNLFRKTMERKGIRLEDPFDWETGGRWELSGKQPKDEDERRRRDDAPAQTLIDVGGLDPDQSSADCTSTDASSAVSTVSDVVSTSAADDTLDNLTDV